MSMRLPHRAGPILFGAMTSAVMSLLVSGVATWRALGLVSHFLSAWLRAWVCAWPIAFAAILLFAPIARRIVAGLVEPPPAATASPRKGA